MAQITAYLLYTREVPLSQMNKSMSQQRFVFPMHISSKKEAETFVPNINV